jgi:hypothetical protein
VHNRRDNLRKSAAAISHNGHHQEHLILDWSSQPAVDVGDLPDDPRIRLVRVEGERSWWLSRALNRAMAEARGSWLLKVDADCVLEAPFFRALDPAAASLQIAALPGAPRADQFPALWGLFGVDANLFALAGGFNEYLHGWGYDEIDLFERLLLISGSRLALLPQAGVTDLAHGDRQRVANSSFLPARWLMEATLQANRYTAGATASSWQTFARQAPPTPWPIPHPLPTKIRDQRARHLLQGLLARPLALMASGLAKAVPAGLRSQLLTLAGLGPHL